MGGVWKKHDSVKKRSKKHLDQMWTKIIKNYVAKSSLELYFFSDQAIENITNTMTETSSSSSY